jgi:peroxiredoxin family protein
MYSVARPFILLFKRIDGEARLIACQIKMEMMGIIDESLSMALSRVDWQQ